MTAPVDWVLPPALPPLPVHKGRSTMNPSNSAVKVAGAPVSFGVFELTPADSAVALPDGAAVLSALVETGYDGVDLGPRGFLDSHGDGSDLRTRLAAAGLDLAGGWIELPLSDDRRYTAAVSELEAALDVFSAAGSGAIAPKPTLADSGDDYRRAHPGAAAGHGLNTAGWDRVARNLADAARRVRDRGFEPTFHHHAGTFVETPEEIDLLLDLTDIGLTLDTGHLLIGGGNPAEAWVRWGSRINHVHLKDVDRSKLRAIVGAGGGMVEVWSGGTFVPLGDGDLDVAAFLDDLVAADYVGWVVIEQDVLAVDHYDFDAIVREHQRNRDVLRAWF